MFKINSYRLFFFVFFFNSSNVHVFSFNWDPIDAMNIFPNTPPPESGVSIHPLFPIESSVTPQPYNPYFNNSTNTFIPSFMLAGWPTNTNTNNFSLPIVHESGDFNDTFANTNNRTSSVIPSDSIPSNTTNTSAHISTPSVVIHKQQVTHTNQDRNHALSKNKKYTKTYTCPTCNKNIQGQSSFNYHIKTHDPNRKRPFQCHLCPKSFAEKSILKNHISRHSKEKPLKCDFCSKHFKTKQEKIKHHRTHTGEKPYKCNFCVKSFTTKSALQSHIRTHTGEKPFKCHLCKKEFSSKAVLEGHFNKHKNKKPYKCHLCAKAYTTKDSLASHLKTHNRPKPYTCHYCRVAFTFKSEYENHMRYEEGENEDRKCHICKKVYSDKYRLREHNKRAHAQINS